MLTTESNESRYIYPPFLINSMTPQLRLSFATAFLSALILVPSCKNHRDKSGKDSQSFLDSAVYANVDSIVNLPEIDFSDMQFSDESKRYNPSAKRVNDILHTRLEVSFDLARQQLYGKARIDIKPYYYPTDSLILDAKAFDVQRVALVGKGDVMTDLAYKNDDVQLHIYLGKSFTRSEPYTIFIQYTANPQRVKTPGSSAISDAKGLYFIDPKDEDPSKPTQIWTQGETESSSCWFPTIDKPNEKMTHEILITVPEKYSTLSNGLKTLSKKNSDGTRTDTWKMDQPNAPYLVMMAIGEFAIVKDTWRKIAVDYYVEKEFEPYARKIFGNTPEMLEFFSTRMGVDYPWPKYSQVVVRDYVSGAMENTSATLFGEFVQQTPAEMIDNDFEDVIAHELFHHWFGDLVTCESWSNLPLNESFATYGEYLWNEYKYGRDEADHHLQGDLNTYIEESFQKKVDLIRFDYDFREDMFDRHSYQKGGCVLHMLRKYLGDEAFFEGLKTYLTDNRFQPAEIHHLRLAFEKVTGEDLNWFFNQWFLDKGHPILNAKISWDEATSESVIEVEQTQNRESSPMYKLPLDVDIYEKGNIRRTRIVVDSMKTTIRLKAAVRPDLVLLDAEHQLLGKLDQHLTLAEAQTLFLQGKRYRDRFQAIDLLLDNAAEPGVTELLKMALRDPFWNIRLYSLNRMDEVIAQNPEDFKSILMQLAAKDEESSVRAAALEKVAGLSSGDATVFPVFEKALSDSSNLVQGAALGAMYAADPERTKDALGKLESTAKGDLLTSIAAIYATSGTPGKFEFLKSAYEKVNNPNDKYVFIQVMGKYALSQDEATMDGSVPTFENIARKANAWWLRLSGIQVLAEFQMRYDAKVDALSSEIQTMIEKGTAVSIVQQKELERTAYKKKVTEVDIILDTIRAEEKDPNLTRILMMMGGH